MDVRECPGCHAYVELGTTTCEYCGATMSPMDENANAQLRTVPTPTCEPIPTTPPPEMAQPIAAQGGTTKKWSAPAILGFIISLFLGSYLAFIPLALCVWGIKDATQKNLRGKGLAIAGIVISVVMIAIMVAFKR